MSRNTFYDSFHESNSPENMDKFMNGPFARERLIAECSDPENIYLLACQEKNVLGYVKLRKPQEGGDQPSPDAIEIARIYMVKEATGRGIGSLLMREAIELARKLGYAVVWLGVWEHNLRAIAFYERWGFVRYGQHVFMLGDDRQWDFLMQKKI